MRRVGRAMVIVGLLLLAGTAFAVGEVSSEKGKSLFNDPKLGTTGKSCNDCHPGGKGIEKAASKKDIEDIVNGCITQNLKGKALDVQSAEMQSLVLYIKSVGEMRPGAGKAHVGC